MTSWPYLGENKAPSPHGAVDIYKWKVIPSLTFNFPDDEGSNISSLTPGWNDINLLYKNLQIDKYNNVVSDFYVVRGPLWQGGPSSPATASPACENWGYKFEPCIWQVHSFQILIDLLGLSVSLLKHVKVVVLSVYLKKENYATIKTDHHVLAKSAESGVKPQSIHLISKTTMITDWLHSSKKIWYRNL